MVLDLFFNGLKSFATSDTGLRFPRDGSGGRCACDSQQKHQSPNSIDCVNCHDVQCVVSSLFLPVKLGLLLALQVCLMRVFLSNLHPTVLDKM
jgi:hypothetical protein